MSPNYKKDTQPVGNATLLQRISEFLDEVDWNFKTNKERPVVRFVPPERLLAEQAELLELPDEPVKEGVLLEDLKTVYELSVPSSHPRFYNQLVGRVHEESLVGSLLADAVNSSMYTFEVSPLFTVMEQVAMKHILGLFGFPDGEGVFAPGGSMGNMYAISLARASAFPQVKELGMAAIPPVRIYVSDQSHYSLVKGASFMGFGNAAVAKVASDSSGRMRVDALKELLKADAEQGVRPLMVVATAGTTVLGAYDPIEELAAVCRDCGAWLHVDGCHGGGAILSKRHSHLLAGCHLADSVTFNPHKMLGVHQQCSMLLTPHKGSMQEAHGLKATYLFQQDKFYSPEHDLGDRVIQCGRKVDVLKLWAVWRAHGKSGLCALIERKFSLAQHLAELLRRAEAADGEFELLAEPQSINVLFWYVPPCLRGQPKDWGQRDASWWRRMDAAAPALKQRMTLAGSMLIGYQRCGASSNGINCWRMVCTQDTNTEADMQRILDEFRRLGQDLSV